MCKFQYKCEILSRVLWLHETKELLESQPTCHVLWDSSYKGNAAKGHDIDRLISRQHVNLSIRHVLSLSRVWKPLATPLMPSHHHQMCHHQILLEYPPGDPREYSHPHLWLEVLNLHKTYRNPPRDPRPSLLPNRSKCLANPEGSFRSSNYWSIWVLSQFGMLC